MFSADNGSRNAEGLLRTGLALFLLLAGIGKLMGGIGTFVTTMTTGMFAESFLPMALVTAVAYIVPVAEVALGVWLLSGWKRDLGLWITGLLFVIFIVGHLSVGDMNLQGLFLYLLITAYTATLPAEDVVVYSKCVDFENKKV